MYTALPVPSEKSTSHMCPITLLLLTSVSNHIIGSLQVSCYFLFPDMCMLTWQFLTEFVAFLLMSNVLDLENTSSNEYRPRNYTCPSKWHGQTNGQYTCK